MRDVLLIRTRSNFDEDVRALVQVKLVHGSWKAEDSNKAHIDVSFVTTTRNLQRYRPKVMRNTGSSYDCGPQTI